MGRQMMRGLNYWGITLVILSVPFLEVLAQENNLEKSFTHTQLKVHSGLYLSSADSLPFWFYSNAQGRVDPSGTNFFNELSASHIFYKDSNRGLFLGTGANLVLRLSDNKSIHFSELFLRAEAIGLRLEAGRFYQPIGLNNHELSVGSMMVSGNATPVPKVSISTQGFQDFPFGEGVVQFSGMFSHGWLEKDRYVESPYLHQKYFYLRVNIGSLSGTGGIVHNAQWGGTDPNRGRLPQSFGDYLRLISGRGADESSNAPGGEVSNVIGNSVAAYEFGLQYRHEAFTASLTRLFYLEDKVSTRFRSPWDGVWGFNLKTTDTDETIISAITYEYINTKNQDAKDFELIGRRDYYDNFVYRSGWTYENRTLGIPLILFDGSTITNNVLVGHHIGFKGDPLSNLTYTGYLTYSRNYGVQKDWFTGPDSDSIPADREDIIPREEFREDQYSLFLGLNYQPDSFNHFAINLKFAADIGDLYDNSFGIMAGITWSDVFGNEK